VANQPYTSEALQFHGFKLVYQQTMFKSLQLLGPLLLLSLALPLALLATLTTTFAFLTLLLRVSIVYFEVGVALIHSRISTPATPTAPLIKLRTARTPTSTSTHQLPQRRQPRRHNSTLSFQDLPTGHKTPTYTASFTSLLGSGGPTRDYEGVGGWRLSADGQDDALWMGINSRLELPATGVERQRRHQRTLSSQSQNFVRSSPGTVRISPATSGRKRTPPVPTEGSASPEGYFSMPNFERVLMSPEESVAKQRMEERRRSLGSNSGDSTSSRKASLASFPIMTQLENT